MKFNNITVITRNYKNKKWTKFTFAGIRAHGDLVDYARNPLSVDKEIMVVEADGICLYSRLSSAKDVDWYDLLMFFNDEAHPFPGFPKGGNK